MTPSPLSRKTPNLSESVRQQLKMYALAASAAGVGTLALSQPSEAKIVYTKTHRVIGEHYRLDLNHDGTADFKLTNDYYPPQYYVSADQPGGSNGVAVNHSYRARALFAGAKVGPNLSFHGARMAVSDPNGVSDWYGPWG